MMEWQLKGDEDETVEVNGTKTIKEINFRQIYNSLN